MKVVTLLDYISVSRQVGIQLIEPRTRRGTQAQTLLDSVVRHGVRRCVRLSHSKSVLVQSRLWTFSRCIFHASTACIGGRQEAPFDARCHASDSQPFSSGAGWLLRLVLLQILLLLLPSLFRPSNIVNHYRLHLLACAPLKQHTAIHNNKTVAVFTAQQQAKSIVSIRTAKSSASV